VAGSKVKTKTGKRNDEKSLKLNELKALEIFIAKSNVTNRNAFFNMLTGNEEAAQIYAYIGNNQSKYAYKELVKFRRRTNYFEFLVSLLQKALSEELTQEISDWSAETVDWLQKRNVSILGTQTAITRKPPDVITVAGNVQRPLANDLLQETERMNAQGTGSLPTGKKVKKRGLKKYKLLIPLDLDANEKLKLEDRQKKAIDIIYDLLPDRYENWVRKRKMRKLFQEEAAYKSQFYAIWALNSFSMLRNRIMSNPNQKAQIQTKVNAFEYLDPEMFLLDRCNVMLKCVTNESDVNDELVKIKQAQAAAAVASQTDNNSKTSRSTTKGEAAVMGAEEPIKSGELKDISDLVANMLTGVKSLDRLEEGGVKTTINDTQPAEPAQSKQISTSEFIEMTTSIFEKFKISTVIAHRGKQWTQLINSCKLMLNCISTMVTFLPSIIVNNRALIKFNEFCKCFAQAIYLAAENLLDMVFTTYPIEVPI
jgi:hypothetical protein